MPSYGMIYGMSQDITPFSIIAHDLRKVFGNTVAVDSIDLQVRAGEFFGFLGPNGAGKSTTIKMLCGLLRPTNGSISIAGLLPVSRWR